MKTNLLFTASFLIFTVFSNGIFAQQPLNNIFEDWESSPNAQYDKPEGWYSATEDYVSFFNPGNFGMKQSADAHTGNYAVELKSMDRNQIDDEDEGYFSSIQANYALTDKPALLSGYYKSDLQTGDTALVGVSVYKNGNLIGQGAYEISGVQNQYTYFEAIIGYTVEETPDSIEIIAISSKFQNQFKSGSITIDNIELDFSPVSAPDQLTASASGQIITAGPNPTEGVFHIWINAPNAGQMLLSLYDILGTKVYEQNIQVSQTGRKQLSLNFPTHLTNGIYIYEISAENFRHSSRVNLRR